MEQFFCITDLVNGVFYNPKAEGEWVEDINKAYFYRHKENAEQLLSEVEHDSILRILDVWMMPPQQAAQRNG